MGCCLSPPSPLKKLTDKSDDVMWGDGDHGGGVVDEGVGGGCMSRVGVLGAGVDVMLTSDHSVVLARVEVLSVLENSRLKVSLALSDEIWAWQW
jgi:hypothetical protein